MKSFILLCFLVLTSIATYAAETRGLTVVAKDTSSNQSGEVKLYNKSYAVIIGIDKYPNLPQDRQLAYAVRDAQGVEQVMKRQYKFDKIVTLYDQQATRDRILDLLTEELPAQMGEDDSLFIFWAGHGNQEKSREGELGYLIPYDGSPAKIRTNITMAEIRDTISKKIPAKHVFYVMDACYSGLMTATRSIDSKPRRDLAYLKEITRERVRQVLTAGSKDQEVLDGGHKGHSVFTGRLIEALEATGDFITANEIQAILKEKVYGDARARNHTQTPGYGTLYGNGDYVFVPKIEEKVRENKAEVARMEAELKKLEALELEAKKYQSEQQQREAEHKRKVAEARLRAEQLRQQQLQEEAKRQQEMAAERAKFEVEQKQREQQLTAAQKEEEQRLAALKAELVRKKQTAPASAGNTLDAAIAEIKRLNIEIEGIEAAFSRELVSGKNRVTGRYDEEIASVRLQSQQKQVPLVRDEFETEAEYKVRVAKSSYTERIAELETRKQSELKELETRLKNEQQSQTADLRQSLKQLADKQFTLGAESVSVELGAYNPDQQYFPVALTSKSPTIKVAMNGTLSLARAAARKLKQEYSIGLVRPQVLVKAGNGDIMTVALANDSDNIIYEYVDGEFITIAERKRREVAAVATVAERERLIYTDPQTGLQWVRNGNITGKMMSWDDAMEWAKNLDYARYRDWRLPTKNELEIIAKRGGNRPSEWLNAHGFNNVQGFYYWSSSTNADFTFYARVVDLSNGIVYDYDKGDSSYVWPVRGGQ